MKKELIIRPIISEKLIASGEYAFEVDIKANKPDIAKAIKEVFNVDCAKIRTIIVKGKSNKTYKSRKNIQVSSWKKAILRLRSGQKIEMFESPTEKK